MKFKLTIKKGSNLITSEWRGPGWMLYIGKRERALLISQLQRAIEGTHPDDEADEFARTLIEKLNNLM